jgi:hypothetical protein
MREQPWKLDFGRKWLRAKVRGEVPSGVLSRTRSIGTIERVAARSVGRYSRWRRGPGRAGWTVKVVVVVVDCWALMSPPALIRSWSGDKAC